MEQVCALTLAEIFLILFRLLIFTGTTKESVLVPLPRFPSSFLPQHHPSPEGVTPHVRKPVADI